MPPLPATMPQAIETMQTARATILSMHSTQSALLEQQAAMDVNSTAMADAFNAP